jgi:hypothetical protein
MNFAEFIKPELLAIIPVLNLIGTGLKKAKKVKDKHIPLLLGIAGVLIAGAYVMLSADVTAENGLASAIFTSITQGLLCAAASVYANQLVKQAKEEE